MTERTEDMTVAHCAESKLILWLYGSSAIAAILSLIGLHAVSAVMMPPAIIILRQCVVDRRRLRQLRKDTQRLQHQLEQRDLKYESKAFFRLDEDDGSVYHLVVAHDLEHAEHIVRSSGAEFCDGRTYDDAKAAGDLTWSKLTKEEVVEKTRCHTEDDRDVIALIDAIPGDWFSSEW